MNKNCWLPQLEFYEDYDSWNDYQNVLYGIFKNDFINEHPTYNGSRVNIRRHPIEFGKEEAFFHITCQDYTKTGDRSPDFRRCERIRWVRAFIENSCDASMCEKCDGIITWIEPFKGNDRVHILLKEERYMVVLELRSSYCLLITAFYFDHDHALEKKLKHYEKYKKQ